MNIQCLLTFSVRKGTPDYTVTLVRHLTQGPGLLSRSNIWATGWTAEKQCLGLQQGLELLLFCAAFRLVVGLIQPPIHWLLGILSLVILQPERKAKYSSPSCTEVKNDWTYTTTPSYAFTASTGTPLTFHLYLWRNVNNTGLSCAIHFLFRKNVFCSGISVALQTIL